MFLKTFQNYRKSVKLVRAIIGILYEHSSRVTVKNKTVVKNVKKHRSTCEKKNQNLDLMRENFR